MNCVDKIKTKQNKKLLQPKRAAGTIIPVVFFPIAMANSNKRKILIKVILYNKEKLTLQIRNRQTAQFFP